MEDDPRTRKKGFFSNQLNRGRGPREEMGMYSRRVLNSYDLKPPDYYVKPQYLIEENVEKVVKYAGMIDGVVADIDITNRTDVLRVIDKGKKQGFIPPKVGYEHEAIFSLSVNNIKISRYNQSEDLLLRIPMHEIAAVCYIKDDGQHILALKHGTLEECSLSVLYCDTKQAAEELCALIGQCFQLVYTEATMQLLDSRIPGTTTSVSHSGSTGETISESTTVFPFGHGGRPSFLTSSNLDLPTRQDSIPRRSPRGQERVPSENSTRGSDVSIPTDLVKDYMFKLHQKLNPDELRHFAELLRDWHNDLPIGEFCEQVLKLYGQDRKHLLAEMSPFIPSADYGQFVEFLRKNGINIPENGTLSSSRSNPRMYTRRSVSELSTASTISNGNIDDVEQILNMVTDHIARLDASVDVETNPENFMHGIDNY
ncbi:cerebral cavernous malformations protein 2 homolog isoform X3 [Haliotis rufescens]|uniref:cerebral cavernous malformations protein 2 homolog isoform X3 n=1 Tax=Haliotis rufescens TaxID=6454 RepID=UPI001EB08FA9|nr:cerebral cavernous malformations protein 2 homolog isoform X3 [Haliotis rufescens]